VVALLRVARHTHDVSLRVEEVEGKRSNCPFCHGLLGDEQTWRCPRCDTVHHAECARENRRCTLLGCAAPYVDSRTGSRSTLLLLGLFVAAAVIVFMAHVLATHGFFTPAREPPEFPTTPREAPEGRFLELAGQKELASDWNGEIEALTKVIEVAPNLAWAWGKRGWARGQKGDWDGAIADSTKALELDPKCAWAWNSRGWARDHSGDLDGAIADYERWVELAPADEKPAIRQRLDELTAIELKAKRTH